MTTARVIQLSVWADRASSQRVRYYCCAIKAAGIGNSAAARYFTRTAQQWESIRQRSVRLLLQA